LTRREQRRTMARTNAPDAARSSGKRPQGRRKLHYRIVPLAQLGRRPRRRVGLLGGSFNPAHDGHRHVVDQALRRLRLDEIWLLVSPQNPLKGRDGMAEFADRMAAAARIAHSTRISARATEAALGTRYTADTLSALVARFPRTHFVWLMGADNLLQVPRWERWTRIFNTVPIAVFARPGYDKSLIGKAPRRFARARIAEARAGRLWALKPPVWVFLHTRLHPASATAIRARRGRQQDGSGGPAVLGPSGSREAAETT
jgi:nicotinate-nucleotide adenylyltransferase